MFIIGFLIAVFVICAALLPLCCLIAAAVSTAGLIKAYLISDLKRQFISLTELVVVKDNKTMCYVATSDDSMTT